MDTITRRDRPRKYVFLNKSAPLKPGYRNLVIIECDPDHQPTMISVIRKGNFRIIKAAYGIHVGAGRRSKGYVLAQKMQREVDVLNDRERA